MVTARNPAEGRRGDSPARPARPAVFFDGSCPLCSAEIATYRKCRGAGDIDWVDVSENRADDGRDSGRGGGGTDADAVAPGLSRADAMRRFHLRTPDGTIVSGGAAFAELWAALPAFSWAGRLGRLPGIRWLLEGAYRVFLPVRPVLQKILRRRTQRVRR